MRQAKGAGQVMEPAASNGNSVLPPRGRRLVFSVGQGWLELLAASPILLVTAGFMYDGGASAWGWLAGLAGYPLWAALIGSVPMLRWTWVLVLCNAAVWLGWGWLLHGASIPALASWGVGVVFAYRGARLVRFGKYAAGSPLVLWMGLAACAPAAFIIHRAETLSGGYGDGFAAMAGLLFAAALLASNSAALTDAAYGGRHVSAGEKRMRRFNLALVLGFGLPVFAVSFWGIIDAAVRVALRMLAEFIGSLLPDERPPVERPPAQQPAAQEEQLLYPPPGKPAWIWVFLERVMMIAVAAATVFLLYLLLRWLARRLPGWLRAIAAWLVRYRKGMPEENTGYVDEVSSTRDGRGGSPAGPWNQLKRFIRRQPAVRWEELRTNGERIRFLYALAVRRSIRDGFKWKPQWTPSETAAAAAAEKSAAARRLEKGLCEAYERARYGREEPGDSETARWRERVGK